MATRPTYFDVPPIERGYQAIIPITYSAAFLAAYPLSGRLVASFRTSVSSATELFRADSTASPATIIAITNGLQITIPGATTQTFPLGTVNFDIISIVGGVQSVIPGQWTWPVVDAVTRGVT